MRIEIHSEAWEEFFQAADRYESEAPGVGRRFRVEIERCLGLLAEHPNIGPPEGRRLRHFVVDDGFSYSLIYQVRTDLILVVSIAHHSRRPGYWRRRAAR
jgi:plasmid stabilization system protein ParE